MSAFRRNPLKTPATAPAADLGKTGAAVARHGRRVEIGRLSIKASVLQEYALVGVIIVLMIAGTLIKPGVFLTSSNLFGGGGVLDVSAVVGVIAIGMTFVIATAGIDLSVGSALSCAGVVGAQLASHGSIPVALGIIACAVAIGLANGFLISYGRVVAFIATLAMLSIASGIALRVSHQTPINLFDLTTLAKFGTGKVLGIPAGEFTFALVAIVGWLLLNRTRYGRHVVAVGGNQEAARIAGVPVRRIIFSVYALAGLCVGIAAVVQTGLLSSASPVAGQGVELSAIGAVVIGGTSLFGGKATIVGTILGVITFALIFNLMTLMNTPIEIQQITKGVIIIGAVLIQRQKT
jgi:ribose transport system permease protein